jgi:formate hydrogenlyase subunit 6/NADH:ubiquinone oxidoreductase subunit I
MPLWFVRGLRRGIVTTRYPVRPEPSAADLPTPPAFDAERIDAGLADRLCGVCPSRALRLVQGKGEAGGDVLIFDAGACTACGRCREAAPGAVATSGEFELAATARIHLVKRIPLRRGARP